MSRRTLLVDGREDDPRRLTVGFTGFIEELKAMPDLDESELARLYAGADLIDSLAGARFGFGAAAPSVCDTAEVAEQVAGITDDALSAALELLDALDLYEDDYTMDHNNHHPERPPELIAALMKLDNNVSDGPRHALAAPKPASERAVAAEFV